MCDYSLHHVASRPAKVGDKLVTTKFVNTPTGGFAAVDNPNVAVCLRPGTELAFEHDPHRLHHLLIVDQKLTIRTTHAIMRVAASAFVPEAWSASAAISTASEPTISGNRPQAATARN